MSNVCADSTEINYCCGVDELGVFVESDHANRWRGDISDALDCVKSGTGYFVSTFINNDICKRAYYELCDKAILLYQSPPRFNPRHGENEVFVCVFLSKDVK